MIDRDFMEELCTKPVWVGKPAVMSSEWFNRAWAEFAKSPEKGKAEWLDACKVTKAELVA